MPPDPDLPAVAPPGDTGIERERHRGRKRRPRAPRGRSPAGEARAVRPLRLAGIGLALALGVVTSLGVAALLGERFREAVLVEVETVPPEAGPVYSDAPREAARFFADRDTVRVSVPRDMTVADFLALYHLENNRAARAALREQLGAADPEDLLLEGDRVTLPLTLRRDDPSREEEP